MDADGIKFREIAIKSFHDLSPDFPQEGWVLQELRRSGRNALFSHNSGKPGVVGANIELIVNLDGEPPIINTYLGLYDDMERLGLLPD